MNTAEGQLELLHGFLAEHPCPAGTRVSAHVQREADSGNANAKRVFASGLFSGASDVEATKASTMIVLPNVLEREQRLASQQLPAARKLNTRAPSRPILQSGRVTPWLK